MTQTLINNIIGKFGPCCLIQGPCLLIWKRNREDIGLLIDTIANKFLLVNKGMNSNYAFSSELYDLFRGYIYQPRDNRNTVFEFEYQHSKSDPYINNGSRLSALRNIVFTLNGQGIDVVLTFKEDKRKVYYKYANNTFWNPERKHYYSLNQKYDEHAITGRYNRINDHDAVFERKY